MTTKPTAPETLRDAGKALWRDVVQTYDLRSDELAVLMSACKTADRIESLERAHEDLEFPVLTRGSMGQDVIHPLIAEIRTQQAHQTSLLAKLKLPDVDAGKTNQQRDAGAARWTTAHGKGA